MIRYLSCGISRDKLLNMYVFKYFLLGDKRCVQGSLISWPFTPM